MELLILVMATPMVVMMVGLFAWAPADLSLPLTIGADHFTGGGSVPDIAGETRSRLKGIYGIDPGDLPEVDTERRLGPRLVTPDEISGLQDLDM